MHPSEARKIITDNNLIPQKISKKIINYINGKENNLETEIFNYVEKQEIIKFKKKFIKIKKKLKEYKPRNLPIYLIIKEKNKNFDWEKINEHFDINLNFTKSPGDKRHGLVSFCLLKSFVGVLPIMFQPPGLS